jgi:DNA primase
MHMTDDVERIKERLDIADIVSDYVELKQTGQYLKGKSPFTDERDPSFYVSPEKGLYHCFSSGQGGDVFTFIQEMEGVEFREALSMLADRAGVTLSGGDGNTGKRKRLREIVSDACEYYTGKLSESKAAQSYLQKRGITEETANRFSLGYAPDSWRSVLEYLEESGFKTEDIITAGLVKKSESSSNPYDRFRNRLLFPIADTTGRPIAFSGRRLDPDDPAKYINSPETPLFRKKEVLYGFHLAKSAMRELDAAILVEGQTDIVLAHQAGFENTVASSGTAITKNHLDLINRFTDNLILALDTDAAGRRAALKTARLALSQGMTPKIAKLPSGSDPADVVTENNESVLQDAIGGAEHAITTAVDWASNDTSGRREFLQKIQDQVLPLVVSIENAITRDHFISEIARKSDVREKTLRSELDLDQSNGSFSKPQRRKPLQDADRLTRRERQEKIESELVAIQKWQSEKDEPDLDPGELDDQISEIQDLKIRDRIPDVDKQDTFAAEVSYTDLEPDALTQSVKELLLHFREVVLQQAYEAAQAQIARTEDAGTKQDLLRKCQEISAQIESVRAQIRKHV